MKTLAVAFFLGLMVFPALAEVETPPAEAVAVLADKRILESSGLVRSLRHPGIFWTHNDSGGEPCVFAINLKGETVAKVRVPKAANFDWEDLTQGQDEQGRPCLLIGDIGDNLKLRASLQIYRIPEPDLPADPEKEFESEEPDIWHLGYPDKRHDAETLMRHPKTGEIYILTKEESGHSLLFKVPGELHPGRGYRLEKVTALNFPPTPRQGKRPGMASMTTSGDFSPDGKRLVICTYSYLYEWKLSAGQPLLEALKAPPHLIEGPLLRQQEAVCYDADNLSLWLTSEQLPTTLFKLKRK